MKSLLIALAFVSTPVFANFTYDYKIQCGDTDQIISALRSQEFNETLSWTGNNKEDNSMYSLWVNSKQGTWTLLKMSEAKLSCVLGVGTNSKETFGESI